MYKGLTEASVLRGQTLLLMGALSGYLGEAGLFCWVLAPFGLFCLRLCLHCSLNFSLCCIGILRFVEDARTGAFCKWCLCSSGVLNISSQGSCQEQVLPVHDTQALSQAQGPLVFASSRYCPAWVLHVRQPLVLSLENGWTWVEAYIQASVVLFVGT